MKIYIKIEDILSWTGADLISGKSGSKVRELSTDSRTIKKGDFFIPVRGDNYDGHDFIGRALEKKACGFVHEPGYRDRLDSLEKKIGPGIFRSLIILEAEDNLSFLEKIAYGYIRLFDPLVIGITGSVGKTTTKEYLVNILRKNHNVQFTPENYNTEIGVSKSILNIDHDTQYFIVELGMRGKGQIRKLSRICNINIGLITAIGRSHIEFFDDIEEIAAAKAEIAEELEGKKGVLFLNNDDGHTGFIEKRVNCRVKKFGRNNNIEFNFIEKEADRMGRYSLGFYSNDKIIVETKMSLPGYHNMYNGCGAAAICYFLGIGKEDIKDGVEEAVQESSRMEIINKEDRIIINDCYNASPLSVRKAVDTLILISKKNNKRSVAVLGDMLELGDNSSHYHFEIGKYLSGKKVDMIISIGKLAEGIYDGLVDERNPGDPGRYFHFKNKEEFRGKIKDILGPQDAILIKGSRANKMEDIIDFI
jgi:UDP-N-acetylmuramoyl-tripeptide--D-alanyl-D-alanine ligase